MTSLTRWLSRFQLSPRSQRVLTEAALDWRHEVATAPTFAVALTRHCRGACGLLRALGLVLAGEARSGLSMSWALRLASWVLILTALTLSSTFARFAGTPHLLERYALLVVQAVAGTLWLGAILAILTGPKAARSPVLGYVVLCAVLITGLAWGVVPMVWKYFAEAAVPPIDWTRYSPKYSASWMLLGAANMSILCAIADRLRIDDNRLRSTVAILACLFVLSLADGIIMRLALQMQVAGSSPNFWAQPAALKLERSLLGGLEMLALVGLWYFLIRRQERLKSGAHQSPIGSLGA